MIRVRFLFQPEENGMWAVGGISLNEKSVGEDRMEKTFKCFNSSEYGIYALNKNSANVPRFIHSIQILNVTLLDFRNGVLTDRIDECIELFFYYFLTCLSHSLIMITENTRKSKNHPFRIIFGIFPRRNFPYSIYSHMKIHR